MAHPICLLEHWEAEDLEKHGIQPRCSNHRHIRKVEACEMTHHGDSSPYARPIARWCGRNRIVFTAAYQWRVIDRWRFPRLNLVASP